MKRAAYDGSSGEDGVIGYVPRTLGRYPNLNRTNKHNQKQEREGDEQQR